MKPNTFFIIILFCIGIGMTGCKEEAKVKPGEVTGTIIGSYSNVFFSLIMQVDEKYPIGKTIEYVEISGDCWSLPNNGTYKNMIQVQVYMPVFEIMDKTISFSYKPFQAEEDNDLFVIGSGIGNAMCIPPSVPIYVITDCKILE